MTEEAAQVDENMPVDTPVEQPVPDSAPADPIVEPEKNKVQLRINKITADKHAAIRRADAAEKRVKELETPAELAEPKLEDFDFDENQHSVALAEYRSRIAAREEISNHHTQQEKTAENNRQSEITNAFNKRTTEFMKDVPDYTERLESLPTFSADTLGTIMQADNGPQLAYYLSKNLDIADEVANASPMDAAMKLGMISAQLANPKPTNQPSAAPDPIDPIMPGGKLSKEQEDMSMDEIYNLD